MPSLQVHAYLRNCQLSSSANIQSRHDTKIQYRRLWSEEPRSAGLRRYITGTPLFPTAGMLLTPDQCFIPCVELLLPPPLNSVVLDMVWDMACWHALAKLRLHTESTLQALENATTSMGRTTRRFTREIKDMNIYELNHEVAARGRKSGLAESKRAATWKGKEKKRAHNNPVQAAKRKTKILNLLRSTSLAQFVRLGG